MVQSDEKKKIHIHRDIQPIADALLYYTRRANDRTLSASIKRMREQYPESRESIDALFGLLEELEQALDAASSHVDPERMHFFFDTLGEVPTQNRRAYSSNLATAVMMPNPFDPNAPSGLKEHCEQLKKYTEEEVIFFARLAFALPNEGWLTRECKDLAAFYDYIQEFPASDAERFRILSIVRNFGKYVDELAEMLRPVAEVIADGVSVYAPLLKRFTEVYRDKQPEEVFAPDGAAPIYDTAAQVVELYPRLFLIDEYYTLSYQLSDETPRCNRLEIGVLYDAAMLYRKRDVPLKELASYVKVIGDPVRLQILTMLKDGEIYVQELTDKLGLSFTTLSHHMTKLMMSGLVTSERRGIYVYYKANMDFLRWLMERVGELLLD
ncbi:MAG: ArsR/SmtB family transcription factor [Faecousia sp.]